MNDIYERLVRARESVVRALESSGECVNELHLFFSYQNITIKFYSKLTKM